MNSDKIRANLCWPCVAFFALAMQASFAADYVVSPDAIKGDSLSTQSTFHQKLNSQVNLDEPAAVVVVLLPDKTYRTFAPADVLTLKHLVEKLPSDSLKPKSRLSLIRRAEGLIFSKSNIESLDLSRQSLSRWDIILIEDL